MPKFRVYYDRHTSTIGQEIDVSRTAEMKFDKRPTRKDFSRIEQILEDEFYKKFARTIKKTNGSWMSNIGLRKSFCFHDSHNVGHFLILMTRDISDISITNRRDLS